MSARSISLRQKITEINSKFPRVPTITPDAAHSLKTPLVWVDCRDDAERAVSVISTDAVREKDFRSSQVQEGATIVAYCTIGYRSAQFCSETPGALNLDGGMLAWIDAGYPVFGPNGELATRVHVWSEPFKAYVPDAFTSVVYSKAMTLWKMPGILLRNLFPK